MHSTILKFFAATLLTEACLPLCFAMWLTKDLQQGNEITVYSNDSKNQELFYFGLEALLSVAIPHNDIINGFAVSTAYLEEMFQSNEIPTLDPNVYYELIYSGPLWQQPNIMKLARNNEHVLIFLTEQDPEVQCKQELLFSNGLELGKTIECFHLHGKLRRLGSAKECFAAIVEIISFGSEFDFNITKKIYSPNRKIEYELYKGTSYKTSTENDNSQQNLTLDMMSFTILRPVGPPESETPIANGVCTKKLRTLSAPK